MGIIKTGYIKYRNKKRTVNISNIRYQPKKRRNPVSIKQTTQSYSFRIYKNKNFTTKSLILAQDER